MPKYRKFIFSLLLTGLFCACQSPVIESLKLENLRLDSYEKEGARQVSLSWTMNAMTPRGINQEAYRILIASRPELLKKMRRIFGIRVKSLPRKVIIFLIWADHCRATPAITPKLCFGPIRAEALGPKHKIWFCRLTDKYFRSLKQ